MTRSPSSGASLACAVLVAGLASCSRPAPIPIGLVTGLTGRHYDLGLSTRGGVQLAVAELNAAGGIGGRPIELVVLDDGQDPAQAVQAVEALIARGVVAIIGHATSAMAEATLPIVNRERIVMISPTVSSATFTRRDDWFFMMQTSTAVAARYLADHVASQRLARRVAAVYDASNLAYTGSFLEHFRAAFEAAGGAVRPVPFSSGKVESWAALAREALRDGTDGVLVIANALDSATLCQQVRLAGSDVQILGAEWGFTGDIVANGGRAVEGARFVQKVNLADASPRFAAFRERYEAHTGRKVDFAAMLGYETVQVLAKALRRDASRSGLRAALAAIGTVEGLQGPIHMDRYGDVERPHYMMTVRDGRVVAVADANGGP